MDRTKHSDITYVEGDGSATLCVKNPHFKSMTEFSDDIYEVSMGKASICYDLPIYIGVWILNMAKMIMLRFVYDVLGVLLPRDRYQICFMDTDSIYFGVSEKDWEKAILTEFLAEYLEKRERSCHLTSTNTGDFYFPRRCCQEHASYDKREPGLFNIEYVGERYIGLCSKTYCCESDRQGVTFSSKGLQKDKVREGAYQRYDRVLESKEPGGATNMGF